MFILVLPEVVGRTVSCLVEESSKKLGEGDKKLESW